MQNIVHSSSSLNVQDTRIAFAAKSLAALKRTYWLFRAMDVNFLVNLGPKILLWCLKLHLPVTGLIRATLFRQFCGGESIADCEGTMQELNRFKIGTILDYSVEGAEREADFDATYQEIMRTIDTGAVSPAVAFSVFKVTGLGRFELLAKVSADAVLSPEENTEYDRVKQRVLGLCQAAALKNVRILIDAEESWIQPAIDALCEAMMAQFNREKAIVYTTVQMYRHDRLAYLKTLHVSAKNAGHKIGVKLVRGAYMEKERARAQSLGLPSPIQPDKQSSDRDYDLALRYILSHIDDFGLCAGTHNEHSAVLLTELLAQHGVSREDPRVYVSQLFGMSDNLSFNLAHHGYNVSKYVPYGPVAAVLPYLFRRAQENTSIKGQSSRELRLIEAELVRREKRS